MDHLNEQSRPSAEQPSAEVDRILREMITYGFANEYGTILPMFAARREKSARHESAVGMNEARYKALVELLPAVTFMASFNEGLSDVYVSPQIESMLGYTQEQWVENPVLWYERLHPDDRERWNYEFAQTVTFAKPLRSAYRFLARDNRVVWLHTEARIATDQQGVPLFIYGIGVDITQIKEAEQKVIAYSKQLEQTNRELEQFAYVASHDLQEPLRSITSYTQLIETEFADRVGPEGRHYISRVVESTGRLRNLIRALLEFSRVGRGEITFQPTNLEGIIVHTIRNLEASIQENAAKVTYDPMPVVNVNRLYLGVLFQNLIGNAIKYRSEKPPRIHISAVRRDESWLISVRDNGIGISPEYYEKIFVVFQRLHTQEQYPGTGIGLAICKKIVDIHGGSIWVDSEPEKGSTFHFTLPDTPRRTHL